MLFLLADFLSEVEAEESIKKYTKPSRKLLQDEMLIKIFGIKDGHGENPCTHTHERCFEDIVYGVMAPAEHRSTAIAGFLVQQSPPAVEAACQT